jgi:flagellar hook protein FlgE
MSLSGAISSAVSALQAQSTVLSIVSDNLANSSTTGYKASYASFQSLLTGSLSTTTYSSGGVSVTARSSVTESGLLTETDNWSDLAVDGSGFLTVADSDGTLYYTRNGEFTLEEDGTLTVSGYTLVGWATDADGNVVGGTTASNLESVDVDELTSYASATTEISIAANLPANAETDATFASEVEIVDSLGTSSTSTVTWTKTGENTWTASISDPVDADGNTVGTVSSSTITITFNEDGTLASTDPSPAELTITDWTTGASDSTISLDLGEADSSTGLTQYSDDSDELSVSATVTQDGLEYGTLSSVAVEDDGTVTATYSNGASIAIYKLAVATFTNADGLTALSGAVYAASSDSGDATLNIAGSNGAGTIAGGTLEASTTDTTSEFSTMIAAQQAYSAAAQVLSTASDMFDSLLSAVR